MKYNLFLTKDGCARLEQTDAFGASKITCPIPVDEVGTVNIAKAANRHRKHTYSLYKMREYRLQHRVANVAVYKEYVQDTFEYGDE